MSTVIGPSSTETVPKLLKFETTTRLIMEISDGRDSTSPEKQLSSLRVLQARTECTIDYTFIETA
jgi:hypothetical protein